MWVIQMNHYITKTADGLIHVQNAVMGHFGQHHVHTKEDFEAWVKKNKVHKENIIDVGDKCTCGLKVGQSMDGCPP